MLQIAHTSANDSVSPRDTMTSREKIAEFIAKGYPSPVEYTARKLTNIGGNVYAVDALPVHLRRK
jgi:hypothetical protein